MVSEKVSVGYMEQIAQNVSLQRTEEHILPHIFLHLPVYVLEKFASVEFLIHICQKMPTSLSVFLSPTLLVNDFLYS